MSEKYLNHPDHVKFRVSSEDETYQEVLSYNDIINHIERQEELKVIPMRLCGSSDVLLLIKVLLRRMTKNTKGHGLTL